MLGVGGLLRLRSMAILTQTIPDTCWARLSALAKLLLQSTEIGAERADVDDCPLTKAYADIAQGKTVKNVIP